MYNNNCNQISFNEVFRTYKIELDPQNRWVILADLIPWHKFQDDYNNNFKLYNKGEPANSVRVALGSLIIKATLSITDEEVVNQIKENKYLQYFLGITLKEGKAPFDSSLMTYFRKRLNSEIINQINETIFVEEILKERSKKKRGETITKNDDIQNVKVNLNDGNIIENQIENNKKTENKGNLILDATVAPSDIKYPTDVNMLNSSRENLEKIIDILHEPDIRTKKKPRTYRKKARKKYLAIEKKRKKSSEAIKKAIRFQLSYVERDLKIIEEYISEHPERIDLLSNTHKNKLETIKQIYNQQKYMYDNNVKKVSNRIVSVNQPYIRPIVRGKAGKNVEFGSKLLTSVVDGYSFIDYMSFDSYNEGSYLKESVEKYKDRFDYYPEAVMADTIFRNKENRKWLNSLGIRMSGPKLGRPSKDKEKNKEIKKQEKEDFGIRNNVEGSYGVAKRKYGLGLIKSKTELTTSSEIAVQFLAMNLGRLLKFLCAFLDQRKYQYNFKYLITLV